MTRTIRPQRPSSPAPPRRWGRNGFTLIELLIVVGVIGILAAVVLTALNPGKLLGGARDADRRHAARTLQDAEFQYVIDHGGYAADTSLPADPAGAVAICREGKTAAGCANVDDLLPAFLPCIPYDGAERNASYTGYAISQNVGRVQVKALYLGSGSLQGGCDGLPVPVARWRFDETAGTVAADASGRGNDGTLQNGPTFSASVPAALARGHSLQLDGLNDYVEAGNSVKVDNSNQGTISAWVNTSLASGKGTVLAYGGDSNETLVFNVQNVVGANYVGIRRRVQAPAVTNVVRGSTALAPNTWYHVAFLSDGSGWSLYVNGAAETLTVGPGSNTGDWFLDVAPPKPEHTRIGSSYRWGANEDFFQGDIDDLRVYNRALTLREIAGLAAGKW